MEGTTMAQPGTGEVLMILDERRATGLYWRLILLATVGGFQEPARLAGLAPALDGHRGHHGGLPDRPGLLSVRPRSRLASLTPRVRSRHAYATGLAGARRLPLHGP